MKTPCTVGITLELLEKVVGFHIDRITSAQVGAGGTSILIEMWADVNKEELTDESIN